MKFITLFVLFGFAPLAHAFDVSAEGGTAAGNVGVITLTNKATVDDCTKSLNNVVSALNKANKVITHIDACTADGATELYRGAVIFF